MTLMDATPLKWSPRGVTDTLDATNTPTGAMASLQNLIRDPTTLGIFVCRPASIEATDFTGFTTPGFISWFHVVGTQVYGLVASGLNPGKDEPFCYDFATDTFIAVTGITGANVPTSPATSGAWVPPTSAIIGVKLVVTHPGFPGGVGNYFGWFDITNPAVPVWNAGNTTVNALPFAPSAVYQFGNRAYYASGQYLVFSDVLVPLVVTLATQALTLGDNQPITALGGLPANNLTGAITQALIAFKSQSSPMQMYQITGDASTLPASDLAVNGFNVATGTLAPMSICATPKGLAFLAPDGLRFIGFNAQITDPINTDGAGVAVPFIYAVEPSRVVSACNGNIMRISTQNGYAPGSPQQEWWFDFKLNQWTGPHTFPASYIRAYKDMFVLAPQGITAKLFTSDVQQKSTSSYAENGATLAWLYQTAMLPDTDTMAEYTMVETTVDIAYPPGNVPFTATAGEENGSLFDSVTLVPGGNVTIWGAFTWGAAIWGGAANALSPRQLPWHLPIVFRRLYLAVNGDSGASVKLGTTRMRYQQLGYLQQALTGM